MYIPITLKIIHVQQKQKTSWSVQDLWPVQLRSSTVQSVTWLLNLNHTCFMGADLARSATLRGWHSYFVLRDPLLGYRPWGWLFLLNVFVFSLSLSVLPPAEYLKIGHVRFASPLPSITIKNKLNIRHSISHNYQQTDKESKVQEVLFADSAERKQNSLQSTFKIPTVLTETRIGQLKSIITRKPPQQREKLPTRNFDACNLHP